MFIGLGNISGWSWFQFGFLHNVEVVEPKSGTKRGASTISFWFQGQQYQYGGPGTEVLCIHLLDAANVPLLRFYLTERYDAQGHPIPERFARYEDLKRSYGRRDGQEVVACKNGMLQR